MLKLAKDGSAQADNWSTLPKNTEIDPKELNDGLWLVPASIFIENADALSGNANIGIWLDSDDSAELIQDYCKLTSVIAINFPVFADGRGFSLAQQLREDLGFCGEIRAIGHFMEEQLFYLKRCGFDSFIVENNADCDALKLILNDFSNNYQGSSTEPKPLFKRRQPS